PSARWPTRTPTTSSPCRPSTRCSSCRRPADTSCGAQALRHGSSRSQAVGQIEPGEGIAAAEERELLDLRVAQRQNGDGVAHEHVALLAPAVVTEGDLAVGPGGHEPVAWRGRGERRCGEEGSDRVASREPCRMYA